MNTLRRSGLKSADITFFAHGTTVVINALTEHKGAKTGLITTRGFRDILEIARGNRPDVFNFYFSKPMPFVPRHLRREVAERCEYTGDILGELDVGKIGEIVEYFRAEEVAAVAICFLHSYTNPANEILAAQEVSRLWPGVSVVASHRIAVPK